MNVARIANLDVPCVARGVFRFVVEGVHRPFAGVSASPPERFDGRKELTRDQHQLQVEGSGDVLNRRQTRVGGGAFEVRDLALPQPELPSQLLLAELFSLARLSEHF